MHVCNPAVRNIGIERVRREGETKERWVMTVLAIFLSLIQLDVAVLLGLTYVSVLLLAVLIPVRVLYLTTRSVLKHPAQLSLWLYIDLSFSVWPWLAHTLQPSSFLPDECALFSFHLGLACLLAHAVPSLSGMAMVRKIDTSEAPKWSHISAGSLRLACLIVVTLAFSTSLISHSLNIAALGQETSQLPFRMAGFLNYFRAYAVPCMFVIILDMLVERWS